MGPKPCVPLSPSKAPVDVLGALFCHSRKEERYCAVLGRECLIDKSRVGGETYDVRLSEFALERRADTIPTFFSFPWTLESYPRTSVLTNYI